MSTKQSHNGWQLKGVKAGANTYKLLVQNGYGMRYSTSTARNLGSLDIEVFRQTKTTTKNGIRLTFKDINAVYEGITQYQMNVLSNHFLSLNGYSHQQIASAGVRLGNEFNMRPDHLDPSLLIGFNYGQQRIAHDQNPLLEICRIRERTYLVRFYDLQPNQQYYIWDKNCAPERFSRNAGKEIKMTRGILDAFGSVPILVVHGFSNLKPMLEHFTSLNRFPFLNVPRPAVGQSLKIQL